MGRLSTEHGPNSKKIHNKSRVISEIGIPGNQSSTFPHRHVPSNFIHEFNI